MNSKGLLSSKPFGVQLLWRCILKVATAQAILGFNTFPWYPWKAPARRPLDSRFPSAILFLPSFLVPLFFPSQSFRITVKPQYRNSHSVSFSTELTRLKGTSPYLRSQNLDLCGCIHTAASQIGCERRRELVGLTLDGMGLPGGWITKHQEDECPQSLLVKEVAMQGGSL